MKNNHIVKTVAFTGVMAATLLSAQSSKATTFAYEGFDYALGTVVGQNGGSGWSTAWALQAGNTLNAQIVAGSYSYTDTFGNTLATTGNRLWFTGDGTAATGDNLTGGTAAQTTPLRSLTTIFGNSGSPATTWVSFLALRTGIPSPAPAAAPADYQYQRASSVGFFYNSVTTSTGQGSEQFGIGRGSQSSETDTSLANDTWGVLTSGAANNTKVSAINWASAPADFILMRIDHVGANATTAGNADTLHLWINPTDLTVAPSDGSADIVYTSSDFTANTRDFVFDRIRLFGGSVQGTAGSTYSYGSMNVDELRFADTFAEVAPLVPEPTVATLFGVAGLAMILRLRKK